MEKDNICLKKMTAVETCWEINIAMILQKYPLKNVFVNT